MINHHPNHPTTLHGLTFDEARAKIASMYQRGVMTRSDAFNALLVRAQDHGEAAFAAKLTDAFLKLEGLICGW